MFIAQIQEFSDEQVRDTANFFTDFHKYSKSGLDHIRIYLCSDGGDYGAMQATADIINLHKDFVTLVAYNGICSAAFEMFYTVECRKELIPGCIGMFHMASTSVDMTEDGKVKKEEKSKIEFMSWTKKQTKIICDTLHMSRAVRSSINKGEDVYFSYEDMQKFLNVVQPAENT